MLFTEEIPKAKRPRKLETGNIFNISLVNVKNGRYIVNIRIRIHAEKYNKVSKKSNLN